MFDFYSSYLHFLTIQMPIISGCNVAVLRSIEVTERETVDGSRRSFCVIL